jgi:hypothetical protein
VRAELSFDLSLLRYVCARNPARVAAHLSGLVEDRIGAAQGLGKVDLLLLLAEAQQARTAPADAVAACEAAGQAVAEFEPLDWPRLTAVLGVSADVAVWAGRPDAVDACESYLEAAARSETADARRPRLAAALSAVAVFHHRDCAQGLRLLTQLLEHALAGSPLAVAIDTALTAMREDCRGTKPPPAGRLPPAPGGVLQPSLDPSRDWLASRVRARRGKHHHSERLPPVIGPT